MIECTNKEFIGSLRAGDIGLILAKNLFSTLQNWRKIKTKATHRASHAFVMRDTPAISEANGLHISNATVTKFVGDTTKCWIFRYEAMTPAQLDDMMDYMDGAVENGGTYSLGGIMQFALQFFGIRKKLTDEQGSFCSEYAVKTILKAGIPFRMGDLKPFEIDPSMLLSWFMSPDAKKLGWYPVAEYDGKTYWKK